MRYCKMIRIGLYSTVVILSLAGCLGGAGSSTSYASDQNRLFKAWSPSPGASWVNNFQYAGNTYDAATTGGVNRTIIKTGSTLKIIVDSTNCFSPADDTSGDCEKDIRRAQIRSHKAFSLGQDLRYNFTVEKEFNHGDAKQGGYINFFEIKPQVGGPFTSTCPTASLYVNPASNKINIVQSLANHCNGAVQQDVYNEIGTMKQGKNNFQIVTKQSTGADGYIKVYQNGVLIYERNGKSSYNHSRPIKFWVGGYICCGKINELLLNGEPNHTFIFANISSAVETAGLSYTPTRTTVIESLYINLLGRQPGQWNPAAIQAWASSGQSIAVITQQIAGSAEGLMFAPVETDGQSDTLTRTTVIESLYINLLGRQPGQWNPAAIQMWVNSGQSIDVITQQIAGSAEGLMFAPVETAGLSYTPPIIIPVKPVVVVTPEVAEAIGGQRFVQTVNNISYNTDSMFSLSKYITFNFGPKNTDNRFVLGFTGEQIDNRLDKPLIYGYRYGNTLFAVATDNGYYGYKDSVLFKNESTQYFIFNHKHQESPNLKFEFASTFATAIADPAADVLNVERSFALGFDAAAYWSLNKHENEFLKLSVGQPLRIERGRIEFDTFIANIAPEGREIKVTGAYGKNYNKQWSYGTDVSYIVDRNNIKGNNEAVIYMYIKFKG